MAKDSSEAVNRIKSILETIEQKNEDVARAKSDLLRLQIVLDRAERALKDSRVQLVKELQKLDPGLSAYSFAGDELEAVSG